MRNNNENNKDFKLSICILLGPVGCKQDKNIRPLTMRVVYRRQKKEYVLGWKIHVSNFLPEKEQVCYSKIGNLRQKDVCLINRTIVQERAKLLNSFNCLKKEFQEFHIQDILSDMCKKKSLNCVETFFSTTISKLVLEQKYGTASQYQSSLSSFSQYLRKKGIEKLLFKEFDSLIVLDYMHYLRKRCITENTVNMYIKILRALYNKARKAGVDVGKHSPFKDIQLRKQETLKRALSVNDIYRIAICDLSCNHLKEQARDIFMFSFYTRGMSFVDIIHLQESAIIDDMIYYERQKTGQRLQIKIESPLREIIEKYKNRDSSYIFPILSDKAQPNRSLYTSYRYALGRINRSLKRLGRDLGINQPLTTYVARHSWATIAKLQGAPISGISESLGHRSENTTLIYLRAFGNEVIEQINKNVIDSVSILKE